MNKEETQENRNPQEPLCCGECAHSHELPGYPSLWCEHLKKWTARQARDCGGGARKPDKVTVDITADGYTLTLQLNSGRYVEVWELHGQQASRISGDIEDDNIVEDMQFPLLCLSSESEHCMKQLEEICRREIIAASAKQPDAA